MAATAAGTSEIAPAPTVADRVVDAARRTAHVSHEVRLLKSVVADVAEERAYAVKRAMKSLRRRVEVLADLKDEAAYRVKRQPLKAAGLALGAGLAFGLALGWIGDRIVRSKSRCRC